MGPHGLETIAMAILGRWAGDRKVKMAMGRRKQDDVAFLKALVESGAYRPVIDRVYPMEQAADAHRYVETWQKIGNVVLAIGGDA